MLQGYRTYIVSALMATFGVLAVTDWGAVIDNPGAGWTAIASSLLMALLRSITTTPPGTSSRA